MEEPQRWEPNYKNLNLPGMVRVKPGSEINVFVHDDDHKRVVARLQARIEELEGLVAEFVDPDPCRYDHHGYCQAHSLDEKPCPHERAKALLDSGEEKDCPDCGATNPREKAWTDYPDPSGRSCPNAFHASPALEGRENALAEALKSVCVSCGSRDGEHWSWCEKGAAESGPDPVAVPEKVEVNRADLELILTDTDIYYPGYAEGSDEPSGLPERGAAAEDRLRAALAAFRATDTGGTD